MGRLDKNKVLESLIAQTEKELEVAIHAAKVAHQDATNEESRPENEYDTRALEASYVARGQAQRVADLKEALYDFKHITMKDFGAASPITATAVIEVECEDKRHLLFFLPKGGGASVMVDQERVQIVTPNTPLGQALLQMKKGDSVIVDLAKTEKEYEILDVY